MRTLVLPPECSGEGRHTLTGKPFHHLCRVRRAGEGDRLAAIDENGTCYQVVVISVSRDSCRIDVRPEEPLISIASPASAPAAAVEREPVLPRLVLCQGLPKGRKLDQIIRQCTEAGVDELRPFVSRYAVAEPGESGRESRKRERWLSIAREAVQQSGRTTVPRILATCAIEELPRMDEPGSVGLLLHQQPLAQATLHEYLTGSPHTVTLVVGPEGGLAQDELTFLTDRAGYRPVFLGPTVLRTETAGIYALAAVRTILRERQAWNSD